MSSRLIGLALVVAMSMPLDIANAARAAVAEAGAVVFTVEAASAEAAVFMAAVASRAEAGFSWRRVWGWRSFSRRHGWF